MQHTTSIEWDAARALQEWPDQRGIWNTLSWRDSLYEFNVFYDGAIAASAYGAYGFNRRAFPEDQLMGFTLTPQFYLGGSVSHENASYHVRRGRYPDGQHRCSWADSKAPVLIVEKASGEVLFEQRQFAHVQGGRPTKRGDEPLFLWLRFTVKDVVDILNDVDRLTVVLTPQNDHISTSMDAFNNIILFNKPPFYPLPLDYAGPADLSGPGFLRAMNQEFGRRNRLAIPAQPKGECAVTWIPIKRFLEDNFEYAKPAILFEHLMVGMPCRKGAFFDVLLPFRQEDDETMASELALGFEGALSETKTFWARQLQTSTSIHVPEPYVQAHLDHYAPLSFMVSERHPQIGDPALLTGGYSYQGIWPTAQALQMAALERLGYGDAVASYLEIFRKAQGAVKPPSRHLEKHPGYFGNDPRYKAVDWLSDHGAILYAAGFHGLLSMDPAFLDKWLEPLVRGCEWIQEARLNTLHNGIKGLLPAGVANDAMTEEQQTWNDAWAYKGLSTTVLLLKRLSDPRWETLDAWAREYRETFQRILRQAVASAPTWTAPNGEKVPLIPTSPGEALPASLKHAFYLDTGPMVLAWAGLMAADDPIMRASVRWYREGPQWRLYRPYSNHAQAAVLDREISSCEPCYSWNIYHSLELGERERFSMGLYGLLAAGASQQTFGGTETREGISGTVFSQFTFIQLTMNAAIEDQTDELHLLRMLPLAFFKNGGFDWQHVPSAFGPLSLKAEISEDEHRLEITVEPPTRQQPSAVILHMPPFSFLESVYVNGSAASPSEGQITL